MTMTDQATKPTYPVLTHWILRPPYATRFVSMADGSLDIEFAPGREDEIADYMHKWIDAHKTNTENLREQQRINAAALAAQAPAVFEPTCTACQWSKDHPKSKCQIHNPD
jgi:hypothetical protein